MPTPMPSDISFLHQTLSWGGEEHKAGEDPPCLRTYSKALTQKEGWHGDITVACAPASHMPEKKGSIFCDALPLQKEKTHLAVLQCLLGRQAEPQLQTRDEHSSLLYISFQAQQLFSFLPPMEGDSQPFTQKNYLINSLCILPLIIGEAIASD